MSGDPNSISQRLMQLELQQPQSSTEDAVPEAETTAGLDAGEGIFRADANKDCQKALEVDSGSVKNMCDMCDENVNDEEVIEGGEPDDLDELAELLVSNSRRDRLLGARNLRNRLTDKHEAPLYSRLLTTPAFDALVTNLASDADEELQFESAWALTNLLAGSGATQADLVLTSGLGSQLIRMFRSAKSERLREQACWALANVAGESPAWRDKLLQVEDGSGSSLLQALVEMWDSDPSNGLLDASSLLLVSLFRDQHPRLKFEHAQLLLPKTLSLLRHPYESMVPNLLWALSYAVEGSEPRTLLLLRDPETVAFLLDFLESKDESLLMPTLRLLCCAAACLEALPTSLYAMFSAVRQLMGHTDAKLRRQALLLLGSAAGGPDAQLEAAVQAGCLTALGHILSGRCPHVEASDETEVGACGGGASPISDLEKRDAFWILPDFMLSRAHKFSKCIIEECLEGLLASLNVQEVEVTRCALLCLRHILFAAKYKDRPDLDFETLKQRIEQFDGLKKIETVQNIDDKEVIKLSDQILNQYFWGNEKKYLEYSDQSQDASPSPVAAAEGEPCDEMLDDGDADEEACGMVKDEAFSSLIGGLQVYEDGTI